MYRLFFAVLALFLISGCTPNEPSKDRSHIFQYTTTKYSFEDMTDNIELAIIDRGFVIDRRSYIGKMLRRTGKDTDRTREVFVNAQQFQFCPATFSRNMMEADPRNIAFCPYIITVYNLPEDPKTVYVMFRRPLIVGSDESKAALQSVEDLLNGIIREALE